MRQPYATSFARAWVWTREPCPTCQATGLALDPPRDVQVPLVRLRSGITLCPLCDEVPLRDRPPVQPTPERKRNGLA